MRDINSEIKNEIAQIMKRLYWEPDEIRPQDWAGSTDTALSLPVDTGSWELTKVPATHLLGHKPYRAKLTAYNPKLKKSKYYSQAGQWCEEADTLPEAICKAWLAYRAAVK